MSAFLSPTNSAECRACLSRRPFAELHHHGGHMNYRCKDLVACAERAGAEFDDLELDDDPDAGEHHDIREVYRGKGRLAPGEPFGLHPLNPEARKRNE